MNDSGVRVGIVGTGNNACALVQGVRYYATDEGRAIAQAGRHGLSFARLGGYEIADVAFSCAFDVDRRKVGADLHAAVFEAPNCYPHCVDLDAPAGVTVLPAPALDGVPPFLRDLVEVDEHATGLPLGEHFEHAVEAVRGSRTSVLVNFLPSGAPQATAFFARVAATAGAAFVNCTPTPVAHDADLEALFVERGLPLLGDDLESQFGSSLLHRTLLEALGQRGLEVSHTYQVNLGGNSDFKNLTHRSDAKRASKLRALQHAGLHHDDAVVDVLPSGGYLPGLGDSKVGYIVVEGRGWLGMPVVIDLKLKVQDSSNAAGIVIDLVRLAQAARDRELKGALPVSYCFKNPVGDKLSTAAGMAELHRFDREER